MTNLIEHTCCDQWAEERECNLDPAIYRDWCDKRYRLDGGVVINFCPFCGAKIKYTGVWKDGEYVS